MPTADDYAAAFVKEHEAGNREKAQIFADAYREALAEEQGGRQPAPASAPAPAAPQQPEADNYFTRSADGLGRFFGAIPDIARSVRRGADGVAGQAINSATLNFADEAVGKGISALTGEPYENIRRDIDNIGEDLPEGPKLAANVFGAAQTGGAAAKAVPFLGTYLGNILAGTVGATVDAVGRAEPGKKMDEALNPWNPALGFMFSAGMQPAMAVGNRVGRAVADKWSRMHGGVANPYLGSAGQGAQEALASSVELGRKANPGAPELNANSPLLSQDLAEGAANVAKEVGGDPLATQVGAAKGIKQAASRELDAAGNEVAAIGDDMARVDKIRQRDIDAQFAKRAVDLGGKSDRELTAAESFLRQSGIGAAERGQKMIEDAAKSMAAAGQKVDRAAVAKVGEGYQDLNLTRLAADTPQLIDDEIVDSPEIRRLVKKNPYIRRIFYSQRADEAFRNGPAFGVTRMHAINTRLGAEAAAGDGAAMRARYQFTKALDDAIPGYADQRQVYREAIGMKNARELGYGFDRKALKKEDIDMLPPEERAEAISAMAERFSELIAPMGGEAQSAAQVAAVANRLKSRISLTFGDAGADKFVGDLLKGARQIQAGKTAVDLATRLDTIKPKRVRDMLAPLFKSPEDLDAFLSSVKSIRANEKTAGMAARKAEGGVSAEWADKAREKIQPLFKGPKEADAFIASVAQALGKREAGKALPPIAKALRGGKVDGAKEALEPAVGSDAAERILAPVPDAARRFALADRVGANMTAIPPEKKARLLDIVRNSISGSIPGVQTRAAISGAAHVERLATQRADKAIAERVVQILTEPDPAKREAAIRLMTKDFSSARLRAAGMFQAQNVMDMFRNEEAR